MQIQLPSESPLIVSREPYEILLHFSDCNTLLPFVAKVLVIYWGLKTLYGIVASVWRRLTRKTW